MKRLCLLLDDIATIRHAVENDDYDPVNFGILAETAGVNGLACTFSGTGQGGVKERDLRLIKEIRKTFFNLRIPVQPDAARLALSIAPDMVTFVDVKPSDPRKIQPISLAMHQGEMEHLIPDLKANDISVAVFTEPEINVLRNLNKLPIDYIEINTTHFTSSADVNEELVNLDKIKSATMAAGKLGFGVNCAGGIELMHIPALAQIPGLEDITIGGQLIRQSMHRGINQAVSDALQLIRFREID